MTQSAPADATERTANSLSPGGLTMAEARNRLAEHGKNIVAEKPLPRWRSFLAKFWSPIAWMLEAAIILQLWAGQYIEAGVIGGLLLFNGVLGFIQEGRAGAALAALKKRLAPTALVRRDREWIKTSSGGACCRGHRRLDARRLGARRCIVRSGSILVDQSMLTGESFPSRSRLEAKSTPARSSAVAMRLRRLPPPDQKPTLGAPPSLCAWRMPKAPSKRPFSR